MNEIRKGKKPCARVDGDIFVTALVSNLDTLSPIIAKIYNRIIATGTWPKAWKTEFVTFIPKGNQPEDPSQCRNISCTNFLSKVLVRLVLTYAKKSVKPKTKQYGGLRPCSTTFRAMQLERA